ncbi:MAG: hypothetical protein KKB50_08025 [Planctomycetes bacterium]|nr:hypothetical protein [Planctomycetota bacterium]
MRKLRCIALVAMVGLLAALTYADRPGVDSNTEPAPSAPQPETLDIRAISWPGESDGDPGRIADDCPYPCGDANCDGATNGFDIDHFIDALNMSPGEWDNTYPNCDRICAADTNGDEVVNGFDIAGFILAVDTGICPRDETAGAGQELEALVDATNLAAHEIWVLETKEPHESEDWESDASVGPYTTGTFTLNYEGVDGLYYELATSVDIDNDTQKLLVHGQQVVTLADIFSILPARPAGEGLITMELDLPVVIEIGNAKVKPKETVYLTDKGRRVETLKDGNRSPDLTQAEADAVLTLLGLKDKFTQTGPPTDSYNCHGWTLTGGARWIGNSQVQKVLDDNGYKQRAAGKVKVGDLVVYRKDGKITHTGIVTKVDAGGNATEIESKWGRVGRGTHKPGDVHPSYGTTKYYHSERPGGHQLKTKP